MRIGGPIHRTLLMIALASRLCFLWLRLRLTNGLTGYLRTTRSSAARLFTPPRKGFARRSARIMLTEEHWIGPTARAQCVRRDGSSDLFIGGIGKRSAIFYDVNELAVWFLDEGLDINDPIFDYIETINERTLQ